MKNMFLEIKELLFRRFPWSELRQMRASDESSVTMTMPNVSVTEEEEDLSIGLVNLFLEEINPSEREDDPLQNDLSRALQRALTSSSNMI
ncbi:hypothetical protein MAR_002571 [Mya arenaria]|uniref:Uncharacterized protein n=1 Tax=Mya arenaria TaxID=6604 RepID=A0ABY7G725_MYAAR|nr:hypothetical protein MAR_002571 [Mya arenaria]